jgi:hypothetical protein
MAGTISKPQIPIMKLLFCPHCQDVFKLRYERRECECGKSWGLYEDERHARIGGVAVPLGIGNGSLVDALEDRTAEGKGPTFLAFVIPVNSDSITDEGAGSKLKFRGKKARTIDLIEALLGEGAPFQPNNEQSGWHLPANRPNRTRRK